MKPSLLTSPCQSGGVCHPHWTGSICLPPTLAGREAVIPCQAGPSPSNMTVRCREEATWDDNLTPCLLDRRDIAHLELLTKLYLTGKPQVSVLPLDPIC